MTACPVCFGDGSIDHRPFDREIESTWTPEEIRRAEARGMRRFVGVVECETCSGTGEVTDDDAKDIMAAARAAVDQVIARARHIGLI